MKKSLYLGTGNDTQKIFSWIKKSSAMRKQQKTLNLAEAALMVIDMQQYFLDEQSHAFVPTGIAILPNVQRLLTMFRSEDRPVIFTRFALREGENDPVGRFWGRTVREGSHESKIVESLAPGAHEKVVRKTSYSSFYGTDLEKYLKDRGAKSLVIAGVLTHLCCEEAAREAFARGFDVFFVADATASFNEEMHLASLINLSSGCVTPVLAENILTHSAVR